VEKKDLWFNILAKKYGLIYCGVVGSSGMGLVTD